MYRLAIGVGLFVGVPLSGERDALILPQQIGELSNVHRDPPCLIPRE